MGRPRKPQYLVKTNRSIRLPEWLWQEIAKKGTTNQVVEQILTDYFKTKKPPN